VTFKYFNSLLVSIAFLLVSLVSSAQKDELVLDNPITTSYLKQHLVKKSPRLILTPEIEEQLKEKLKNDPLVKSYYEYLKNQSEEILLQPLIKRELEGFRLLFVAREMMRRMSILSLVYRIDGDGRILKRIDEEVNAACNFVDWNPIHFLDVAEMSFAIAMAVDWSGHALPKATVRLAKKSLIEKAIMPSYNENGERMGWLKGNNNWNTICHSGMIIASLTIAEDDYELAAKTISRALNDITGSLKAYAPDGVYPEGPSYWEYGTSYGVVASNVLTTALGSDFGISASPGFMESARFRLLATSPIGQFFNFSDSSEEPNGRGSVLLAWFAAQTGDANYFDRAFFENPGETKGGMIGPGLIWLSQYKPKTVGDLPKQWFGDGINPVAILRGESNDFYLASKGGRAQLSHGNIDAGSFVFDLDGIRWVLDPGNQQYYLLNKIGFELSNYAQDSERWSLLTKGNTTHSTISVNDARFNVKGSASITQFDKGSQPTFTIDMSPVLEGQLNSLQRTFTKESDRAIRIEDDFEINENTKYIRWAIMTTAEVQTVPNGAILSQAGKQLKLSILTPGNLQVSVTSFDPPPLKIDKTIPNLKRVEVIIPAHTLQDNKGKLTVRLAGE
jgi:hypothetical protein